MTPPGVRVLVHAPGPARHGVVRHADAIARSTAALGVVPVAAGAAADLTHAQFTDALYGPDIASAARAFADWASSAPRPLVVTLHDVPGDDSDPDRDVRRGAGYAVVAAASDVLVVSAEHEAAAVRRVTGRDAVVIPLPIEPAAPPGPRPPWATRASIVVLGFVHRAKGHADAVAAAARHPDRPLVVAAGVADGRHEADLVTIRALAADVGVELLVTGWLSDAELVAAALAATVPMAPARQVSASGSLATWLSCGRRPVTARNRYTSEVAARRPGALALYDDADGCDALVAAAMSDPAASHVPAVSDSDVVGAAHAALYRGLLPC